METSQPRLLIPQLQGFYRWAERGYEYPLFWGLAIAPRARRTVLARSEDRPRAIIPPSRP
jgi:hypothetical protein